MASLQQLEKKVATIEQRNARVEADKAWETSFARRGLLVLFTYFAVGDTLPRLACPTRG